MADASARADSPEDAAEPAAIALTAAAGVDPLAPVPAPAPHELPRRVDKPWGHELVWAHTGRYVGKLLQIDTGKRLSLQHHEVKDEWIHVLSGRLLLTLENDDGVVEDRELGPGEGAHVPTRRRHRYTSLETCTLIEVSTPELLDVVRLEDDFGREGTFAP